MLCHPYADRVECRGTGKAHVIKLAGGKGENRIAHLKALHDELIAYFETKRPAHVLIEYL